jgi:hypothetical protein
MPVLPNSPMPSGYDSSSSVSSQIGSAFKSSFLGAVGLSSASGRQNVADMFQYAKRTSGPITPAYNTNFASNDWRVRISLAPNSKYFYNDANNKLLSPLVKEIGGGSTDPIASGAINLFGLGGSEFRRIGVVFPYTPQLAITHAANYSPQKLTHNNYANYFYDNSEVQAITISGEFTVQNVNEGQYLLASVYFFRSVTKMFFGNDPLAGNPPPLVYLNGYGQYYLPNVPCVVTAFTHTMPAEVDYMDIPEPAAIYDPRINNYRLNNTRLPTTSTVSVTLQPVYSRKSQSQNFSLNDFARGALINAPGSAKPASAFGSTQPMITNKTGTKPTGGFI